MANSPIIPANPEDEEKKKSFISGGWRDVPGNVIPGRMQNVVNKTKDGLVSKLAASWGAGAESVAQSAPVKGVTETLPYGGLPVPALMRGSQALGGVIEEGVRAGYGGVKSGIEKLAGGPPVPGTWTEGGGYVPPEQIAPGPGYGAAKTETREGAGVVTQPIGMVERPTLKAEATPQERRFVGGAPEETGMRTSYFNMAPEAPTGSFGGTAGGGVIPTGGYQGFVDSEMAKIERDRAEYEAYRKGKEEEELLGLGPEGQARMKKRVQDLYDLTQGLSKKKRAGIIASGMEKMMGEEAEARRTLATLRSGRETTVTSATIRAGATQQAAMMKAQAEAQKLGIDVAKLDLEQQKLGIEGAKADATIKESMARVSDLIHKNQMWEPMKLQLEAEKSATKRKEIQTKFAQDAATTDYQQKMKAWDIKVKASGGIMTPELQAEGQEISRDFAKINEILSFLNPQVGQVDLFTGKNRWDGERWVSITEAK